MKFRTIQLLFKEGLHLGDNRQGLASTSSVLHSDSFYGAIMGALAQLGHEITPKLEFTISSFFPFIKQEKTSFFFPKPYGVLNDNVSEDKRPEAKKFKKIRYYDQTYFEAFLNKTEISNFGQNNSHLQGMFLSKEKVTHNVFEKQIDPHVRLARVDYAPEKYEVERMFFSEGVGLFCLLDSNDSGIETIKLALEHLQDEGVGSARHVGNGAFSWEIGEVDIKLPQSDFSMNMGLYCPKDKQEIEEKLNHSKVQYDIVRRGGWITSEQGLGLRKRPIYMFLEGSIFHKKQSNTFSTEGKTVNLQPTAFKKHPIYRVGKTIFIPVKV